MMIEKPILFCGEMVKAVLAGRKTKTRRIVKHNSKMSANMMEGEEAAWCPYGAPGDELWVRETHWLWGRWYKNGFNEAGKQKWTFRHLEGHAASQQVYYSATKDPHPEMRGATRESVGYHKRPSIFMPRWASRIQLRVTDVRVERVQEISAADVVAEGVKVPDRSFVLEGHRGSSPGIARNYFKPLWDSINGKPRKDGVDISWAANPWVWCVEFERIKS